MNSSTSRLGQDGKFRQLALHHGNFVAAVQAWADVAVFVDFVGQVFALGLQQNPSVRKIAGLRVNKQMQVTPCFSASSMRLASGAYPRPDAEISDQR